MSVAIIVEDEIVFQRYLESSLSKTNRFKSIESFTHGRDAVRYASIVGNELKFALVDVGLPDINGIELVSKLRNMNDDMRIIIVTVLEHKETLLASMKAGAFGYLLKDGIERDIENSLEDAIIGNSPISSYMARCIFEDVFSKNNVKIDEYDLTDREIQLLKQIYEGYNYSDISKRLNLKISTVHSYSRSLFRKIKVNSKSQAISFYRNLIAGSEF